MTLGSTSSRYETFRNGRTPARYGLVAGSNEKIGESKRASSSIRTPNFSNYELSRREGDATSLLILRFPFSHGLHAFVEPHFLEQCRHRQTHDAASPISADGTRLLHRSTY